MFIMTEQTPNPASLKFLPGRTVMGDSTAFFPDRQAATRSPLAERLFAIDGVSEVFFGADFVTVTKAPARDWVGLRPLVLGALMVHFVSGELLLRDPAPAAGPATVEATEADRDTIAQIEDLIDARIRPAVARDGGDIRLVGFDRGIVYLHLQGACSGCPSSTATLKARIENLLRHYIPDIVEVRAVS